MTIMFRINSDYYQTMCYVTKRLLSNYVLGYTSLPIIVFNCVEQISKFPKRTLPKFRKLNIKVHQKSNFVRFDIQLVCEITTPKTR